MSSILGVGKILQHNNIQPIIFRLTADEKVVLDSKLH